MPSQIQPNRQEVSDRFPMLGFTIRTDGESKRYEVAIAVDATLFQPDAKTRRTTSNFYSSRAAGLQPIDRGEAVYVLPPEILARFVGNERLFYALATYSNGDSTPELSSLPSEARPYISLRSLSGRSLKRIGLLPSRQRAASSYGNGNELEWAGDILMPGTQEVTPAPAPTNGKSNGQAPAPAAEAAAFEYRDGFGPLPPAPARRVTVRAQSNESYTLNWDEVEQIPQPTNLSCWAAAAAMVIGWRDQICLTPNTIAEICGRNIQADLLADDFRTFAQQIGLTAAPPQCYTPYGLRNLLENYGPVWVCVQLPDSGHAIVVTGMYSSGAADGSDTYVRITDPWDRIVGSPGAPGAHLPTHDTGSRYIMNWANFTSEYEGFANSADDGTVNAQILHSASTGGRQPNRSGAAGYAMSLGRNGGKTRPTPPPPKLRSQTMNAPVAVVSTIATAAIERIVNHQGNITWSLDQLRGLKHPNDVAPTSPATFHDAPTILLNTWPYVDALNTDRISAWFSVDWQYNGRSLGNVQLTNTGTNGAWLQGLQVEARIMDDNIVYPRENPTYAALRIRFHYRFTRAIGSDWIAITDLHLFGDGTHEVSSRWEQQ